MHWRDRLVIVAMLASVPCVAGVSAFAQSDISQARQPAAAALIALHAPAPVLQVYAGDAAMAWPATELPRNLSFHRLMRSTLESMIRKSATFRRQCQRLANTVNLRVRVQIETVNGARARTVMGTTADGLIVATANIKLLEDVAELIAHEIEHVIEYLDGVDLAARASLAGTGVRRDVNGAFETARAVHVGRAVAREVRGRG